MFREPYSFEGHRPIKVNIEQLVASQDSMGGPSSSWTSFAASVPAAIENTTGDEKYGDQQIEGIDHWQILVRYMRGVNEKMRVNFTKDGITLLLDITSVRNPNGLNRWLLLECKSGVSRG